MSEGRRSRSAGGRGAVGSIEEDEVKDRAGFVGGSGDGVDGLPTCDILLDALLGGEGGGGAGEKARRRRKRGEKEVDEGC